MKWLFCGRPWTWNNRVKKKNMMYLVRRMIFIVREQRTVESSIARIKRLMSYAFILFYNFELLYIHDGPDSYSEFDRTFE